MQNTIEKKIYFQNYYQTNREKILVCSAKYRLKYPNYNNDYYQKHKEKLAIQQSAYQKAHLSNAVKRNKKWRLNNPNKIKLIRKAQSLRRRAIGYINKADIQRLYEDNIKKFGTLTCYLCNNPIVFGDDSIDHKRPISKSGNNDYCNLAIAHLICNIKKSNIYYG